MMEGQLFDIQHFAVHDGPGIRTLVFLKGCPMNCAWCCNPESKSTDYQIRYIDSKCNACFGCLAVCPADAITPGSETTLEINFDACKTCISKPCIQSCNYGALTLTGYTLGPEELLEIICKDIPFFRNSGGGVTFTGGEPLMQPEFLVTLLKGCKDAGIHTAIETCGYANRADLKVISELTDLFLFDVKIIDAEKHREHTGQSNQVILENLEYLTASGSKIILRFPLIPGITDTDENVGDVIRLMERLGLKEIDLEPWHSLGVAKYGEFGIENRMAGLPETGYQVERLYQIRQMFASSSITC
jgi:pyruvate formate lyase activating enzyme